MGRLAKIAYWTILGYLIKLEDLVVKPTNANVLKISRLKQLIVMNKLFLNKLLITAGSE